MSLSYLVYVSQAAHDLSEGALADILRSSQRYNATRDISGALLFVEGRDGRRGAFMQLLEGEEAELEQLRSRIFDDPRHHTKVVLERGPLAQRNFAEWSMAFRAVTPPDLADHPEFAELADPGFMERCQDQGAPGAVAFLCEFWNAAPL
ncbi:MAG: BLUF domain-containing protein [Celeribacter sp.]|jgi:hypothetical protein